MDLQGITQGLSGFFQPSRRSPPASGLSAVQNRAELAKLGMRLNRRSKMKASRSVFLSPRHRRACRAKSGMPGFVDIRR